MSSFSLCSEIGNSNRGIKGNCSVVLTLAEKSSQLGGFPQVLYEASCKKSLTTQIEVSTSLHLDAGSELPETVRVLIFDEHPLMVGQASAACRLTRADVQGDLGFSVELPVRQKRDLLILPKVDLHVESSLALEDDASFIDDGFATYRLQTAQGVAKGRIWSETDDIIRLEMEIGSSTGLSLAIRDSPIVKALEEAEAAAVRLPVERAKSRVASDEVASLAGGAEAGLASGGSMAASDYCVRAEDVILFEALGGGTFSLRGQLQTGKCGRLCRTRSDSMPGGMLEDAAPAELEIGNGLEETQRSAMLISLNSSSFDLNFRDARASVGGLSIVLPSFVHLQIEALEALINAEGLGRVHLHATWKGLEGQVVVSNAARQMSVVLPPPPQTGGAEIRIGAMGKVSMCIDGGVDAVTLGNRVLDEEATFGPLLKLAAMFNLQSALDQALNFARVVRNVLRSESVWEPKDAIPAGRLSRLLARVCLEAGTNGEARAMEGSTLLEQKFFELVTQVIDAKGVNVTEMTRLLWDFLPPEACRMVQHHTSELDWLIKYVDAFLRPTESTTGPDASLARETPPSFIFRRELEDVAPCAARLYELLDRQGSHTRHFQQSLARAAPFLTTKQVEHLLRCERLSPELRQRLTFILGLKRRAEKVALGYGGPAFMPQGMVVGFFLATAMRGSLVSAGAASSNAPVVTSLSGEASRQCLQPRQPRQQKGSRLASLLREQRVVAAELARLQDYQHRLAEETSRLAGLDDSDATVGGPLRPSTPAGEDPGGTVIGEECRNEDVRSMLECLAPDTSQWAPAKVAIRTNTDLAFASIEHAARVVARRRASRETAGGGPAVRSGASSQAATDMFDLGTSLLGPAEVAVLLQSGLAAFPQGRQVQQNQRMLLEILVSQPPLFLKGVLYELSNNGSSRVLANHLLALLDVSQDAIRPHARLDVADLLTAALGVHMPRRNDFMAGGSRAGNSYTVFVLRAAKQVLEECEPYVALRYWLQRAELPVQTYCAQPAPAAKRTVDEAIRCVRSADELGKAWLQGRHAPWAQGAGAAVSSDAAREVAVEAYRTAFASCSAALKSCPEMLRAEWLKEFWARNYDALTVVSVLRNAQQDVDTVRQWIDAQLRLAPKGDSFCGPSQATDDLWSKDSVNEARLLDCLLEILFWKPADRDRYRQDPLMQLVIDEPAGCFDFTVISAMGVITEGAAGTEMASTYARLEAVRGVKVVRADTATLQTVDYNAACIERAVRDHVRTPWGWLGYSQGCANAFRAEALMLQGTPRQRELMGKFRCRQLLFSAANGSAHGTCSEWKLLHALVDGERFLKRFQANMSRETQLLALKLVSNGLSSRMSFAFLGSMQSMTHEGARQMWRDGQHCHTAPSTSMIAAVEPHTLPECLQMLSKVLYQQMDYSCDHDTQVAVEEAIAHPLGVQNANAELLAKVDFAGAIQRTHHWSPLREEVDMLTTKNDRAAAVFETPKDRHVFPWLEVNARFGFIERLPSPS
eukprot:TRINITY_DN29143_c0_g1_i1.p1 TRINITY_DN29143_c0_g1~~TRINITY_DN29143_c0_g1_i1.p1  ORF type:complete len:1594 (-),score=268.47 TRINITY_DN29143_c0_g1_i1:63-4553(-)